MRAIRTVLLLLALGAIGVVGLAIWRSLPQNELKTARGDVLDFADFGFAIEGMTIADRLGPPDQGVEASGRYVCVGLRVMNHMELADFTFRDGAAVLVDEQGRSLRADAAATRATRGADATETVVPPGASRVTQLAFDVPDDATGLRLRFDLDSPLMNLLDIASDGQRSLALE